MSFALGGIPIRIQPVFFLIAALLGFSRIDQPVLLVTWVAVVLGSVLLHELGHALAFRRFGHRPAIELHGMGGHTHGSPGRHLSNRDDLVVSLAGPGLGLLVGLAVWGLISVMPELRVTPILGTALADLLWVNIGWSLLNLLPIVPLDGGRVLQAGLRHFRPARATELAYGISAGVAFLAALAGLAYGMLFAAVLAGLFGVQSFQTYQQMRRGGTGWAG